MEPFKSKKSVYQTFTTSIKSATLRTFTPLFCTFAVLPQTFAFNVSKSVNRATNVNIECQKRVIESSQKLAMLAIGNLGMLPEGYTVDSMDLFDKVTFGAKAQGAYDQTFELVLSSSHHNRDGFYDMQGVKVIFRFNVADAGGVSGSKDDTICNDFVISDFKIDYPIKSHF